jgi:hypothetical protein
MSDRAVGLGTSRQGPERTTVIYEDGSVLENGPCMPGHKIDSITNTGNTSVVISSDVHGNRWSTTYNLVDKSIRSFNI